MDQTRFDRIGGTTFVWTSEPHARGAVATTLTTEPFAGAATDEWRHQRLQEDIVLAFQRTDMHRRVRFHVPDASYGPAMLVHPGLTNAAAHLAILGGGLTFHGAAIVVDGRSWVVFGDREDGKSTLTAACALLGITVLSDDVIVLGRGADGPTVFTGPRFIDLRPGTADHLRDQVDLMSVRHGTRQRLGLPACPDEHPLAGFVLLAHGDPAGIHPVPVQDRLPRLAPHRWGRNFGQASLPMLDLLALPVLDFRRPRDLLRLTATTELLLARLVSYGSG